MDRLLSKDEKIAWLDSINLDDYGPENYPVIAMVKEYRKHLADTMRENERLREAMETVANVPELIPDAMQEDGSCIMCGFNHKRMADFANKALSNKDSND